ncbi:MAG: non-hydrolyzing UDP-N-acetylglucosamine 2-epimerase [Planctomycetota bacterium]|nr:UDP-N-acetylglucosamine 2-epimerase (non-hydrolyzing) [Planctomycetota bacterium]
MKVLHVVGARPNFMKVAPLYRALKQAGHEQHLLHTGQHYDRAMSTVFFDDLGLPEPDSHLGVGSGTHAEQTARVMLAFEPKLLEVAPDLLVVVGDVNSTVACSLVAAKCGVPIAHVEAGLRSGDWSMPEEINRVLTDRLSDLLFTHCADADDNLRGEGVPAERIHRVGNIMIDTLVENLERAKASPVLAEHGLHPRSYAVFTLHRPANVDTHETLAGILGAVCEAGKRAPVIFSCHPRTAERIRAADGLTQSLRDANVHMVPPLGYLDFLHLVAESRLVITDSGGLQEETTYLRIPCVTIRDNTERPVTITQGTNILAGTDPAGIRDALERSYGRDTKDTQIPELWDGKTAPRIVEVLERWRDRS